MKQRRVARMMKKGETFIGLEMRGFVMFLPTLALLIALTYVIYLYFPKVWVILVGGIVAIGVPYVLFFTEERTGKMGYQIALDLIAVLFSETTYNLNWEGLKDYDRFQSLEIRVKKYEK